METLEELKKKWQTMTLEELKEVWGKAELYFARMDVAPEEKQKYEQQTLELHTQICELWEDAKNEQKT
jgi:hypothetical protein